MKAVICPKYGPPEVLQFVEIAKPVPRNNEVLVKIRAVGVAVADSRVRSFTIPKGFEIPARFMLGFTGPRHNILGVEFAGDVEAVGKNVSTFKAGDAVFGETLSAMGANAEYKCFKEGSPVAIKPFNISYEEAAAIPIGALTAVHFLKRANLKAGQKILVYGASGSVGTYALQVARHFGAEVTGVCGASNIELVKSLGAHKVIDYTQGDFASRLEKYDVVFVAIDKLPFSVANQALNENGVYLNVTAPFRNSEMRKVKNKKVIVGEGSKETPGEMTYVKELVEKGVIRAVIEKVYPFDQIIEAHRHVDKGHKKGNVVVRVA